MVVLQKVGQVELVAEQNGLRLQTQCGERRQWRYAVHAPSGDTEYTPDRLEAGRWFEARLQSKQ